MARKKQEELTPRQRQSQKIMRDKKRKKKLQHRLRQVQIASAIAGVLLVAGGGFWTWKTGVVGRKIQAASDYVYAMTVRAGFSVQTLYLEGRNRTPMNDIDAALDINKGAPILQLSLDEVRARLEKIESVKFAAVERALPDTLYVRIVEREPVALWQYQGKIALVDDNGVAMNGLDSAPYRDLPLIVGEGAPKHVAELLDILSQQPELAKRFSAGVWVGDRRWNIRLTQAGDYHGDIEVRLPEKNPQDAWKQLAELQKKEQVLDRAVLVIDLRIEGRLFIKLPQEEIRTKPANAKDT